MSVEKKLTEDYRKELEEKIRLKNEDLDAHAKTRPEERQNPEANAEQPRRKQRRSNNSRRRSPGLQCRSRSWRPSRRVSAAIEELQQIRQAIAPRRQALPR